MDGTDDSYLSKSMNFVEYVLEACPLVLFDRFSEGYKALSPVAKGKRSKKGVIGRREYLKQFVDGIDASRLAETGVINVELITENIVGEWLAGFKGKNETTPSKSVYGMAQSALVDLFKKHGSIFPQKIYDSIKDIQNGAKRARAQEKVDGRVPMEEGKAAIPGHLYLELMEELMRRNDLFTWVFSVCSWCLMCRVSNVADLRGAHLSWIGDSLLLSIVRHKADKEGERTDAKHCYANPFNPSACVITAIAAFFSVFGVPKNAHDAVFEGDRQHDRFVESLRRVLNACPMLKAKFQQLGITEEDIAAHSFRKGARSYAQGGTTSGPSTPSVHLRGGWALEGWNFVLLFFLFAFCCNRNGQEIRPLRGCCRSIYWSHSRDAERQ